MLKSLVESCSGGSPRSLSVGHAPKSAVVEGGKGKGEGERLSFITFSQLVLSPFPPPPRENGEGLTGGGGGGGSRAHDASIKTFFLCQTFAPNTCLFSGKS